MKEKDWLGFEVRLSNLKKVVIAITVLYVLFFVKEFGGIRLEFMTR